MADFEYSAFISYRNGIEGDDLLATFANQLHSALLSELAAHVDIRDIFLDQIYLKNSDDFVIKISNALSNTFCYVVVFTPNYLSKNKLFCAAELMGMLELEQKRFEIIGENAKSFIFTILLRGEDKLPEILKKNIYSKDFTSFTLSEQPLKINPNYTKAIKELAEEISKFHDKIEDKKDNILSIYKDFKIKDPKNEEQQQEIINFVNQHRVTKKSELPNS